MLANGAALEVIAREPAPVADRPEEQQDEIARRKRRAKTSTLVLVSAASADVALAAPASQTGGGHAAVATPVRPAPGARPRSGGGGGTEGGGAGAGQPPRDRIFNQDDLMGVLIVLAVLLLMALYFLRSGGGGAPADERILNTQSAATEPVAEPLAPPPDRFGNRAVDLTPRSPPPPPVESAIVAATPPPPQAETIVQTYFCTASSQLTPAAQDALERQVADWGVGVAGGLVVAGYADTRGSTEYNRALGSARASAVADFLRSRNFTVVELSGIGELEGLADNENCANQRRVDIRLARGAAEPPSRSCAPPPEAADLACG